MTTELSPRLVDHRAIPLLHLARKDVEFVPPVCGKEAIASITKLFCFFPAWPKCFLSRPSSKRSAATLLVREHKTTTDRIFLLEMSEYRLNLDEIEAGLSSGNVKRRLTLLQRVTDLFVAGSRRYSDAEIALFDDVLMGLVAEIEIEARKRLAERIATLPDAPPKVIRRLAFDDAIAVAGPVLAASPRLSDADLVENASSKSQDHLYAIAQRLKLSESVTDVLIERGNRRVVRRTARNAGARFSLAGYERVVEYASRDRKLALTIGRRSDIPRQCYLKLLETASAEVRKKLEAINPSAAQAIRSAVAEIATTKQREVRESSLSYARAERDYRYLFKDHRLSETNVHAPATDQHFEKTAIALSMLGLLPIDIVERALLDKGTDMILILAKAAGCSWTTAKAMLTMHTAGRSLSTLDIENAFKSYELLRRETARRVVKFYERRFGRHPVVPRRRRLAAAR